MKELARAGEYDNVAFHRVIEGFMAQTGDVQNGDMEDGFNIRAAGTGGSSLPDLPAEFSKVPHARGSIGAARSANPNSANSQFFINFKDNDFLNGQYTVYGQVISGMEHVDAITRGEPSAQPDRMISVKVARRCCRKPWLIPSWPFCGPGLGLGHPGLAHRGSRAKTGQAATESRIDLLGHRPLDPKAWWRRY